MNEQTAMVDQAPAIPPGAQEVNGKYYLPDSKGNLVPLDMVKAQDQLEDEMVRKIFGFATDLSAQISRFKEHSFGDIGDFQAMLDQEYGAKKGGAKGNVTFMTFDGLKKVQVQVADLIEFGPQLQTAKVLIDECLNDWSADSRPELRTIVTRAFNVDKEGQVNRAELYRLRRWDIADERWQRAMDAITDASRSVGSKEYLRFYERDQPDGKWRSVTIDLASA